ncbi:Hypothetical predicted protein [Olea europaea subsp. europaea]|uniref:Transmembrane protein n=1 Tax=Olea europaea subsp. europaea TaxID=158383 RepID=A0A8S0TGW0_OLEEU|nr:Hypothetical predicted protein [Olea europaea subsp. europaea]
MLTNFSFVLTSPKSAIANPIGYSASIANPIGYSASKSEIVGELCEQLSSQVCEPPVRRHPPPECHCLSRPYPIFSANEFVDYGVGGGNGSGYCVGFLTMKDVLVVIIVMLAVVMRWW